MKKIFITSSGTNAGKTLVTCALVKALKEVGKNISAVKPVISGFNFDFAPNDIFLLCDALEILYTKENVKKLNLYAFTKPLSPDIAAKAERKPAISLDRLVKWCGKKVESDFVIFEGAGGLMTPLNATKTNLDLIKQTADEAILVVGSYLGSLSHTLTAYKTLVDNFKKPVLLVVSQNLAKSDELYIPVLETIKSLEKFVGCPILAIEKLPGNEATKIKKLSKILTDAKIHRIIGR